MAQPWNVNIERIRDISPDGEGSNQLKSALHNLFKAWHSQPQVAADLDTAVVAIASELNWNVEDARQAFAQFIALIDSDADVKKESQKDFKEGFIGSREQLLFAHVVGNELNIAPVFAALLSPTGGMVGPGPFSIHVKGGVLGYHGVAHDAGGYLCRCFEVKPGYEYIKPRTEPLCEKSSLAGQVSGIAFWSKLLDFGWLNFLAVSDPTSLLAAPTAEEGAGRESGSPSVAAALPPRSDSDDGVILSRAEVLFLNSLIMREFDPADEDLVAQGLKSLQERDFVSGNEQDGYTVNDQLVLAMAIYLEPQLTLEASAAAPAVDVAPEAVHYCKWGDYIVEQTSPAPGQIRLAGLRDAGHASERLQQVVPLAASDREALSLSLTQDEYNTAVSGADTGEFDPGSAFGSESTEAAAANAELAQDLGSGQIVGSIRIQKYDGRELATTRELEILQGSRATWLVGRDPQQAGQVDVALATPAAIDMELGLTTPDS